MKISFLLAAAVSGLLLTAPAARAAELADEASCLRVLQSDAGNQQKDAAIARLKRIGTAQSIPVLQTFLLDENLSHSARYALESMDSPAAGDALVSALEKTSGSNRAGILLTLGNRAEASSAKAVVKYLGDANADVADAAARAGGKIATADSIQALQAALKGASGSARDSLLQGLLIAADRLRLRGNLKEANALFASLRSSKEKESVRTAVYEGLIRTAGPDALRWVTEGIEGTDPAEQIAALQLARDLPDRRATPMICALLTKATPALQAAIVGCLAQRGDASAVPAIIAMSRSQDTAVRASALNALGLIGGPDAIQPLADAAAGGDAVARQALLEMRGSAVTEAMITQISSASPAVRKELIQAVAGRAEKSNVPKLMELAQNGGEETRAVCLKTLAVLADGTQVGPMVGLVLSAKTAKARSEAQEALAQVCQRTQSRPGFDLQPIVRVLAGNVAAERKALMPLGAVLADPRVRAAMIASLHDPDASVQEEARRAVCESVDYELLPEILVLARTVPEMKTVALRGYARLATLENPRISHAQRIAWLKAALQVADRSQEKWLVIAGLANVPDAESLRLAMDQMNDKEVLAEASQAALQIGEAIRGTQPELVGEAVKKVLASTDDPARKQAAEALQKKLDASVGFIVTWQVAGPYQQEGLTCKALFDKAFPPEIPGATNVQWKLLSAGTDPKQPGLVDLLKGLANEHLRVGYARARIYSPVEQPVLLEFGSDDGNKVWLNGQIVHANNVERAITIGSDKVKTTLKQGWNPIMLKITQNIMGWEFSARVAKPDGTRLDGIRFDTGLGEEK